MLSRFINLTAGNASHSERQISGPGGFLPIFAAFFVSSHYPGESSVTGRRIEHADLVAALGQIDSYIDVTEDDLLLIHDLATGRTAPAGTGG